MSNEDLGGPSRRVLQELMATPVGGRWMLKAGLVSAAAMAAADTPASPGPAAAAATRPARARPAKSMVPTALQFALGAAKGVHDLTLVANGARYPLVAHTPTSRRALQAEGGLWAIMNLSALSHHVPAAALPADRGMLISVHGRRGNDEVLVSQVWHAPAEATLALAAAALTQTGSLRSVLGSAQRLSALGIRAAAVTRPDEVVQLDAVADSYQTAVALTMCHPNVATIGSTPVAATKALLGQTPPVQTLGSYINQMQSQGEDFATLVPATNKDGSPAQIKIGSTTTTFSTVALNQDDATFVSTAKSAFASGVRAVRDEASLGAVIDKPLDEEPAASTQTWVQTQGVVPAPRPYAPAAQAGLDIKILHEGFLFGTKTVANGSYAGGKLPLKIYNNFVRWIGVYVQYLGQGGKNLSVNPSAKYPDTRYSQQLAILPQVFTVLGVPIWDTNTIDVTLDFPPGASTARMLYCGLGADALGGGWRQYFPSDAYPDRIAPTGEVLAPALITGILTIGITVFALATDLDIAATWGSLRKLSEEFFVAEGVFEDLYNGAIPLTAAETVAAASAAGAATYADLSANGGNPANLWNILLGLASVIPKIIFNPKAEGLWVQVADIIATGEAADKLVTAIPIIGQVIAIASAIGDAVTLAEVTAETIVSPWVIENEVSLTYQATVTISRDPRAATFPVTARTWRLEALIDGASALDPVTGTINEGGKARSDPLVLTETAPFCGKDIQWSFVLLDEAGNQVGTGVSAKLTNDDPANPPATVAFAITQLPATITASTVFERASTTSYSTAAGGYTWSDKVADAGTVTSKGIEEVTGTAVATLAGVAGIAWKQGDRYYLRGAPVAQNGATITLGTATRQGYVRRPFLLFDAFVQPTDQGNHVLVEPDDTSDGYHVRKVSFDPATANLSWDPAVSYGMFTLPVSAAALHSSGKVIALHTDSGRIGLLQPVSTPRPHLAAYSAGPGTQVGLLQSPIAVAVTNPGVVLVLEAGASRLSAFDLNANPVRYFGTGSTLDFTLPLVSAGTYLDLAVDGANQIYVLYYTNDGSVPADYRVDVYTEAGVPLDTRSPGVNVPHLAVDYWRSIFAASYNPLTDLGATTPHIDPILTVAEPALSRFDPTNPAAAAPPAPRR